MLIRVPLAQPALVEQSAIFRSLRADALKRIKPSDDSDCESVYGAVPNAYRDCVDKAIDTLHVWRFVRCCVP